MAPDKSFAKSLLGGSELGTFLAPYALPVAKLCTKCENMDFSAPAFQITDSLHELRRQSSLCDFCQMRWRVGKDSFSVEVPSILFQLVGSDLQLNNQHPPVISLLACDQDRGTFVRNTEVCMQEHTLHTDCLILIQTGCKDSGIGMIDIADSWPHIGLPRLPTVGSEEYSIILRSWLEECDEHHENCRPRKGAIVGLPTRLLEVGGKEATVVRLYETKADDELQYLALSHPWGPQRSTHFCTYPENLALHLQGIPLETLPRTFQDAVVTTRNLNHRYLWIDSICIVQGPKGDFNEEAKRMEGVFRQAYCVLAASCAEGQQDGFMKPRDERSCLKIHQSFRPPIYACDFIDNFQQHALDSHLNKRGWVLQERALARRTIFFTNKQTYWECGAGVRCETTTRMNK